MFKVGERVHVLVGRKSGVISELFSDTRRAIVCFRIPREIWDVNVCPSCCFPGVLSKIDSTGEFVCKRRGCDYKHGFEVASRTFLFEHLVKIIKRR